MKDRAIAFCVLSVGVAFVWMTLNAVLPFIVQLMRGW